MAVKTVFKVTFESDRDFLPENVEKLVKTIKGFMPLLQMLFDRIGIRRINVKLQDDNV